MLTKILGVKQPNISEVQHPATNVMMVNDGVKFDCHILFLVKIFCTSLC